MLTHPEGSDAHPSPEPHVMWSSRFAFVMAAVGSAVGLGNIWKFPYMAGTNGGGAFVLVYLGCVALIGLPILMAEVMIGRADGPSPVGALRSLAIRHGASSQWGFIGAVGAVTALMVLSFYSVVAGWALAYVPKIASGDFLNASGSHSESVLSQHLADPLALGAWHTVFIVLTILIIARGVGRGIERAVVWLMPALFALLVMLVAYAAMEGAFLQGASFLLTPDFSALSSDAVLSAAGHAFFTLSVGLGAMIVYGGYLPAGVSIPRTAILVASLDTSCALLAGLAIFPLVFANGLDPEGGPGLVFVALPVAFGNMEGGNIFGALFFILLAIAALTSAVALLEPMVAELVSRGRNRAWSAAFLGSLTWSLGFISIFSFNIWADVRLAGDARTLFDWLNLLTSDLLLPLGGIAIAIFAGWVIPRETAEQQLGVGSHVLTAWRVLVRYVAPAAVTIVLVDIALK